MNHPPDDPLRALEREAPPPPGLKGRLARSLKERGLLREKQWPVSRRAAQAIGAVAVALMLFTAGVAIGRHPRALATDTRSSYLLMLYEGGDFRRDRPEAELIAEYSAWAASLRARGILERGEKLDTGTRLLSKAPQGEQVQSGEVVSSLGVLTGFFIIRAADDVEATAVARTCPHLGHGGRIAVRRVLPTS
jgi:hypothetical protein